MSITNVMPASNALSSSSRLGGSRCSGSMSSGTEATLRILLRKPLARIDLLELEDRQQIELLGDVDVGLGLDRHDPGVGRQGLGDRLLAQLGGDRNHGLGFEQLDQLVARSRTAACARGRRDCRRRRRWSASTGSSSRPAASRSRRRRGRGRPRARAARRRPCGHRRRTERTPAAPPRSPARRLPAPPPDRRPAGSGPSETGVCLPSISRGERAADGLGAISAPAIRAASRLRPTLSKALLPFCSSRPLRPCRGPAATGPAGTAPPTRALGRARSRTRCARSSSAALSPAALARW